MKLPENVKNAVRGIMNASLEHKDTMLMTMMSMENLRMAKEYNGSQELIESFEDITAISAMLLVVKVMAIAESDHQVIMCRVN